MRFEERTDSFIYYPDGESVSCEQILLLSKKLSSIYTALPANKDKVRPISFSAGLKTTPTYVAACWVAGIPFFVVPPNPSREVVKIISTYINPIIQISEQGNDFILPQSTCARFLIEEFLNIQPIRHLPTNPEDICAYLMTSGTTGLPKIAAIKRKNILHAAIRAGENVSPGAFKRWLLMLPLNHVGGLSVILRSIIYGSSISDFRFEKNWRIADELSKNTEVTMTSMVPTQLYKLLEIESFKTHKQFKAILLGGGPSTSELILRARERKIPVMKSYGMTETAAQFTCVPIEEIFEVDPATSGKPLPDNRIEIRDSKNNVLDNEQSGMVYLKSPQVIDQYIFPSEANVAFDAEGWFNTGDYGYMDNTGNLYIEMRRSDMIVTGGENVSPVKVENALLKISGIKDAAVTGIEDPIWGQKIIALVVADVSNYYPEKWVEQLKSELNSYEIPRDFKQIDVLPRNELGKLNRSKLNELAV